MKAPDQVLFDKIKQLPPQRVAEVEGFVDSCAPARTANVSCTPQAKPARQASPSCGTTTMTRPKTGCDLTVTASRLIFGHVVLVPFQFTDQTDTKKRPAVVISASNYTSRRSIWWSPVHR